MKKATSERVIKRYRKNGTFGEFLSPESYCFSYRRMMFMRKISFVFLFIGLLFISTSFAEDGFTQKDRELLIELRVKTEEIDKRFEQVDKRFEQVDKRFEQVDKRFEELRGDMNKRLEELREDMNRGFEHMFNFVLIIAAIFTPMTVVLITIVFWDRMTIIKKAKQETIAEIEKNRLSNRLLEVLKELSKGDEKLATALRQFHLL